MNIKKITAVFLAAIAAISMSYTVCADTTITEGSSSKTANMNVSYTVQPSYTVTIPASVTIGGSATVSVKDICIEKGKKVEVKLSSAEAQNNQEGLKVSAGTDTSSPVLDYTIKKGAESITVNSEILSAEAGKDVTASLEFTPPGEYTYSGTYQGTITFAVSVS